MSSGGDFETAHSYLVRTLAPVEKSLRSFRSKLTLGGDAHFAFKSVQLVPVGLTILITRVYGHLPLFLQNHKQLKSLLEQAEGEVDAFERRFKLYKAEQLQQLQVCFVALGIRPLYHCLTAMALIVASRTTRASASRRIGRVVYVAWIYSSRTGTL